MKRKISISIEDKTLSKIETLVSSGQFRNKSHALEYALKHYLENGNKTK